jgi:hypothetical protein
MTKHAFRAFVILAASLLLFGCGEKLELKVKATMDGRPANQAKVAVDGKEQGFTDANGDFSKILRKKPGAEVEVTVSSEIPGYRITPWKGSFLMKLPKSGKMDTYAFDAELPASHYVTLIATDKGTPVADAVVKEHGKEKGKTDEKGEFVYEYEDLPKAGVNLTVNKPGYSVWRKTGEIEPGQRLEAALSKRVLVRVTALAEEYGQESGIPGIAVTIGKKFIGKTNARGVATYSYDGEPGKKVRVSLSAPGRIPATWRTTVVLEGEINIQRYFYPSTPKPIRVGIYRFVSNTPSADMKDLLTQTETALAAQLFKNACFREVPSKTLQAEIKRAKIGIEKITAKGWRGTRLRRTVDMIILGSVAQDDRGLLIETKFYTSGGKLILSQLTRARSEGNIKSAVREITAAVLERFPFEGTVIGKEDDRYRVNIGRAYKISRDRQDLGISPDRKAQGQEVRGVRRLGRGGRSEEGREDFSWRPGCPPHLHRGRGRGGTQLFCPVGQGRSAARCLAASRGEHLRE